VYSFWSILKCNFLLEFLNCGRFTHPITGASTFWRVGYLLKKTFIFKTPYFFCLDLGFFFFIIIFFLTPQNFFTLKNFLQNKTKKFMSTNLLNFVKIRHMKVHLHVMELDIDTKKTTDAKMEWGWRCQCQCDNKKQYEVQSTSKLS
jgi:hypothetical protein